MHCVWGLVGISVVLMFCLLAGMDGGVDAFEDVFLLEGGHDCVF